jgi:hypothetical protein
MTTMTRLYRLIEKCLNCDDRSQTLLGEWPEDMVNELAVKLYDYDNVADCIDMLMEFAPQPIRAAFEDHFGRLGKLLPKIQQKDR